MVAGLSLEREYRCGDFDVLLKQGHLCTETFFWDWSGVDSTIYIIHIYSLGKTIGKGLQNETLE